MLQKFRSEAMDIGMAKPNSLAILGSTILKYHNLQLDDISQMVTKYTKYQLISNKLLTVQKTKKTHTFFHLFEQFPPFRLISCLSSQVAQLSDRCTEHDFRRGLRDLGLEISDERYDVLLKVLEKVAMGVFG